MRLTLQALSWPAEPISMQGLDDLLHGRIFKPLNLGQQIDGDTGSALFPQLLFSLVQNPWVNPVNQHGKQGALQLPEGLFRHPYIFLQFLDGPVESGGDIEGGSAQFPGDTDGDVVTKGVGQMTDIRPLTEQKITLFFRLFKFGHNLTEETALLAGGNPGSGLFMGDADHLCRFLVKLKTAGEQLYMPVIICRHR